MIEFKLPSLGADMDEGKLLEWKIKRGDHVKRGDVVAVVDTSKAAVDIEIWDEGTVHELVVQPGTTVPVGAVLARLLKSGERASEPAVGEATESAAPGVDGTLATAAPVAAAAAAAQPARLRISPAARKRALELGIDAATIPGTGPGQAVTLEDIERAAAATRSAAMQSPTEKTEQMRCAMAIAMARSKREIPHYYLGQTISLGAATAWLEARNATRPVPERVLLAALLIKAVALACRKHTAMNGFYLDGEFAPSAAIHVGVAISLRQGGLVAPALHDADQKDLGTLMAGLSDLVQRARAGSLRSSEMADPTITVTNLGDQGVEAVYGVIYPPQVALVGFGAVTPRPWVEGDSLTVMPCATGSLSADHRVSTGHQGALFLAEISRLLQQPESL